MANLLFVVPNPISPAHRFASQAIFTQLNASWRCCRKAAESPSRPAALRAIALARTHLMLARRLERAFHLTQRERSIITGKYLTCTCALAVLDLEIARNCYDPEPAALESMPSLPKRRASNYR